MRRESKPDHDPSGGGRAPPQPRKGRGAVSNFEGRFETATREASDDGWDLGDEPLPPLRTTVLPEQAKSIISRNQSPDIPFEQSVNPYRGCEHGCVYCYARPSHAYLNLSPGLDFETRLFFKPDAAALLDAELRRPGYRCSPLNLGANTDPYQPIERQLRVTRQIIETLQRFSHPLTIVTKGAALVLRDLDLLRELAQRQLVAVTISLTTLDDALKRTLEPRAASPGARLRAMRMLADAGVPVGVLVAPVIPFVTDAELERLLQAAADAGATTAHYVMLRLPHEVSPLFREWLDVHLPLKAGHVMSLIQQMRGGKDYDAEWGKRQRGEGEYAALIARRFALACRRLGLDARDTRPLDCSAFAPPPAAGDQLSLL